MLKLSQEGARRTGTASSLLRIAGQLMPSRFVRKAVLKRPPIVVIDLSERTTRAAVLQWKGEDFAVRDYGFLEAPSLVSSLTRGELAAHLRALTTGLSIKCKHAVLLLGMQDVASRSLELPMSSDTEFRELLKLNTAKYFKQNVSELVVDCVPISAGSAGAVPSKDAQVLGVGVKAEFFRVLLAAARDAGLHVARVTPSQVGLSNAIRFALPESAGNQVVVLIEFGPKTCAITAVAKGQPALTRVVELDETLNSGLDEAFATPYPVADEIRANLIRTRLQKLLFPIGRDISAAIDFFEAQLNCRITGAFFSGGTERAELTGETLQAQLDVPCQRLDVSSVVKIEVPNGKGERAARELQRLGGCVGAAAAHYRPELVQINLLAERLQSQAARRRDPVRLAAWAAAAGLIAMLSWAGYVRVELKRTDRELARIEKELKSVKATAAESAKATVSGKKIVTTVAALDQHATNRFLFAPALNALQGATAEDVQVVHLSLQRAVQTVPGVKPTRKGSTRIAAKKGYSAERVSLVIQAKNYGDPKASDAFMDSIATHDYFTANLRKVDPVTLKNRTPRQVDPLDPNKVFTLFTIECSYPERILGYE